MSVPSDSRHDADASGPADLAGADPWRTLPRDREPPSPGLPFPAIHDHPLSDIPWPRLENLADRHDATLAQVFLAAWQTLLLRHSGHDDLVLDIRLESPTASRPLRLTLDPASRFTDLLRRLRRELHPSPPFPDTSPRPLPVGFGVHPPAAPDGHRLDLHVLPAPPGPALRITYDTQYFQPAFIRHLAGHYHQLLHSIAAAPDQPLADLELASPEEHAFVRSRTQGSAATPEPNLTGPRLERLAALRPEDPAVVQSNRTLTFGELHRRSNRLGHYLQSIGVRPEVVVAFLLDRSPELIAAVCATHKAGGAVLLLDPATPEARLHRILDQARPVVILTHRHEFTRIPPAFRPLAIEELAEPASDLSPWPDSLPAVDLDSNHAAVLYLTSGSTGVPKLVVEPFGYVRAPYDLTRQLRLPLKSSSGTTFTISEILNATRGATVVVLPEGLERDLPRFATFVRQDALGCLLLTPSALQVLLDHEDFVHHPALHTVYLLGETIPPRLKSRFHQLLPRCQLVLNYGTTEARACLSRVATPDDDPWLVDAGRPNPGMEVCVLDSRRRLCPVGVPGEIHVGGQIARGYLNDPEATRAQFIPHPFDPTPGARLFATRDRGRMLPDGTVQVLGRLDHQVKIRGYRVELGEIEATLATCPHIQHAAVVAFDTSAGDKSLAAFVVPAGSPDPAHPAAPPNPEAWREHLRRSLPEPMIPGRFVALDALPLTSAGKIDRQKLTAFARDAASAPPAPQPDHAGPRTDVERTLVEIWETLLDLRPIGIHDAFFDVGGNSLSAVRLMFEVRNRLGRSLSLATLAEHPTIARLATLFAAAREDTDIPTTGLIHGAGNGPVLFFIPGIPGINYIPDLVRQRAAEVGRYCDALQFPGVDPGETPLDTVDGLAREMIVRLRRIHPRGPISLAGYSLGGVVALEMARQLAARHEAPALVLLYDAFTPDAFRRRTPVETLRVTLRHLRALGLPAAASFLRERWRGKRRIGWAREVETLESLNRGTDAATAARKRLFDASFRAARTFPDGPRYDGLVVLLRARDRSVSFGVTRALDPHNGWLPHLARPPVVEDVPGDHWTLVRPENAAPLAARTAHWLGQIQPTGSVAG